MKSVQITNFIPGTMSFLDTGHEGPSLNRLQKFSTSANTQNQTAPSKVSDQLNIALQRVKDYYTPDFFQKRNMPQPPEQVSWLDVFAKIEQMSTDKGKPIDWQEPVTWESILQKLDTMKKLPE